jgi:hypothetical protein
MPILQVIHNLLSARADPCVDQAIAQALPTADRATLADLAAILLDRRHTQGGIALVEQYHRLPEPTRQAVLQQAPELTRALRLAMDNSNTAGPANALHIIRRSASVRLAYLVPDQLRHGQDGLKDEAALCLLEMAGRTTADDGPSATATCDAVETAFVVSAVRDAIRFFAQHQRKDVLLALFALPLPAVTELLESLVPLGEAWTQPTGVLLTRSDTPAVRRGLIPALAVSPLQPFALDGIGLALETGHITEALRHWHLLCLRPYRRRPNTRACRLARRAAAGAAHARPPARRIKPRAGPPDAPGGAASAADAGRGGQTRGAGAPRDRRVLQRPAAGVGPHRDHAPDPL